MTAYTKAELTRQLAEHLVVVHHVDPPTRTVMNYLETKFKYVRTAYSQS